MSQNISIKDMKAIVKTKLLQLESWQLLPTIMAEFLFGNIDNIHKKKVTFFWSILKEYIFSSPDIIKDLSINNKITHDINNRMALYYYNLTNFPLLQNWQIMICNRPFITVMVLCLLSYAHSSKVNPRQAIISYKVFAYNIPKRTIEMLYQIGIWLLYKIICWALAANAHTVNAEIRLKTMR